MHSSSTFSASVSLHSPQFLHSSTVDSPATPGLAHKISPPHRILQSSAEGGWCPGSCFFSTWGSLLKDCSLGSPVLRIFPRNSLLLSFDNYWCYEWLKAAVWVLGIEPRKQPVPNHWATYSTLLSLVLFFLVNNNYKETVLTIWRIIRQLGHWSRF